jgi:predicted  nucleic acid-binding Zn-ribbon protein
MNKPTRGVFGMLLLTSLIAASSPTHAQAPRATAPAKSTEEALLTEVRLIRETLQRAQSSSQRERMVVERMRMHDERVERLTRQIAEVRDEIGGIEVHVSQMDQREAALDLQMQQTKDPNQRQALDSERKETRFTQDAQTQHLNRLKDRESAIAAQLLKEERALRTLEARLDALDREIEAEALKRNGASKTVGR